MSVKKFFGIVEGFFSDPIPYWNNEERLRTINFILKNCPHFNAYFYTPKNDPWIEKKPFDLYPSKKLKELKETIGICKRNGLTFIYGFNPLFDIKKIRNDFDGYIALIIKKIEQLLSIGARNFCILYDEIPFALNFVEEKFPGENDKYVGTLHAKIINVLLYKLKDRIKMLWFCPACYFFTKKNPYLEGLMDNLDISVSIIWTGADIFTKQISTVMFKKAQAVSGGGRKIIYWDNYPVNDCFHAPGVFHIGAFNQPSRVAAKDLDGIFINPMRECYANLIVYLSFDNYLGGPDKYERGAAMAGACKKLFGSEWRSYYEIYQAFSDKNSVDAAPRGYCKKFLAASDFSEMKSVVKNFDSDIAKARQPKNFYAKKFFQSIRPVTRRAAIMHRMFVKILSGRPFRQDFYASDFFPVRLHKKYLTRHFSVITDRIALLDFLGHKENGPTSDLEKKLKILNQLYFKYKDKNKLYISEKDSGLLLNVLRSIIMLERKLFIGSIDKLPPLRKIKLILRRMLINGY